MLYNPIMHAKHGARVPCVPFQAVDLNVRLKQYGLFWSFFGGKF